MAGWQAERFAREGRQMQALNHYLNPPTEEERKRAVLDMFRQAMTRQSRTREN
jgi:hypothetical protein